MSSSDEAGLSDAETHAIHQFVAAARAYRSVIETATAHSFGRFLRRVQASLLELYHEAIALPDVAPATEQLSKPTRPDLPRLVPLGLHPDFTEESALYSFVFDPFETSNPNVVMSDLRADLREIYDDLGRGLAVWDQAQGSAQRDAAWDLRFDFGSHWGRHATDALRAVHWLLFEHYIEAKLGEL